jgi:hypothetical protein
MHNKTLLANLVSTIPHHNNVLETWWPQEVCDYIIMPVMLLHIADLGVGMHSSINHHSNGGSPWIENICIMMISYYS